MKKVLTIVLIVVLFVGGLFVLTGCDNNNGSTSNGGSSESKTEAKSGSEIVGSWKNNSYGSDYIYTFNEDGTGKYDAAGTLMEFTYTIDGSKISILYTGNTDPFETEFKIDGDTLNVIDSLGKDTLYQKVK